MKLTPEQQVQVLELSELVQQEVRRVYRCFRRLDGDDEFFQVGMLAACKAVLGYSATLANGRSFESYARRGIRSAITWSAIKGRFGRRGNEWVRVGAWQQWPLAPDSAEPLDLEDYRRAGAENPALHEWCSDGATAKRVKLTKRERVALYLRCVEGWTLQEIGDAFDVTREGARLILEKAVKKIPAGE